MMTDTAETAMPTLETAEAVDAAWEDASEGDATDQAHSA
jgi:hypothetical protein